MSFDTLTAEPSEFTAGDTVRWTRSLPEYPATAYTLSYGFGGPSRLAVTTTASGSDHAAVISRTTSATLTFGVYHWESYITEISSGERIRYETGSLTVRPNLAETSPDDSFAATALAAAQTAYKSLIAGQLTSWSAGGKSYTRRNLDELRKEIDRLQEDVNREKRAEALAAGLPSGRNVFTRFVRP